MQHAPESLDVKFINPYLIDEAYSELENEGIMEYKQTVIDTDDVKHDHDHELLENKEQITDTMDKFIFAADAFIIVYDTRFGDHFEKIPFYLDKIFKIKGFNEEMNRMKQDEMCFFPIMLMGINDGLETQYDDSIFCKVPVSIETKYAMDHCIDFARLSIYDMSASGGNPMMYWEYGKVLGMKMEGFIETVLTYYYYQSLTQHQIQTLQKNKFSSVCSVL